MKALRKPPLSAWATNQVARGNALDVKRLLKADERLRAAQSEKGDPGAFLDAVDEQRRAVDRLTEQAGEILRSAGHAASDATLARIATNLRTAAVSEDGRRRLERGRFEQDLEPAGFDAFAGVALPAPGSLKQPRAEAATEARPGPRERRREAARAKLEKAQGEAAELDERAGAAEKALAAARREVERAEREAKRLRASADRAAARVEKLERESPAD